MPTCGSTADRRGLSLTEILIGIMILGIGVISLATLFPIGLLRMKRAVNDVRGALVSQSAWNEVRVRNLLAPPFGPPPGYFSGYPNPWPPPPYTDLGSTPIVPVTGPGVPVIIDPLWMAQANPGNYADPFGVVDMNRDGTVDFPGGEGLLRVRGGAGAALPLTLASEVFSSHDDVQYGAAEEGTTGQRTVPVQDPRGIPWPPMPPPPPHLGPTYGVPFAPASLPRERRYTWLVLARKVSAAQVFHPGADGLVGDPAAVPPFSVAGADDVLHNVGPDLLASSADDPARSLATGTPVPAPVGPFDVSVVVFYNRDATSREAVYANSGSPPLVIFTAGSNLAVLRPRADGLPYPQFSRGSYIMDTTFTSDPSVPPALALRNGYIYRVTGRSFDTNAPPNLILTMDRPARANGLALTVLKGVVGVFERQVP